MRSLLPARAILDEFWRCFEKLADELLRRVQIAKQAPAVHLEQSELPTPLLQQLRKVSPELSLEVAATALGAELIVSADGDRDVFPAARALVAAAPVMQHWTIRALRPRRGFPDVVRGGTVSLPLSDLFFEPLERELSDDLGLRILARGLREADVHDAYSALMRALESELGEEQLALALQYTEVRPLPPGAQVGRYMPLKQLADFIRWRAQRLQRKLN